MSERDFTAKPKPSKPYPDFPLTPHPTGRWCKKICGKLHYFGRIADGWKPALEAYLERKDRLYAGLSDNRDPGDGAGVTMHEVCRRFLRFKQDRRNAGELSSHLFDEYGAVCRRLLESVGSNRIVAGLGPDDFAKLRRSMTDERGWGVYRVLNEITRVKSVFKFASEEGIIARPPIYGQAFRPPTKKDIRVHRAAAGSRAFTAEELRGVLEIAEQPMRAMILLGLNAALSNSDIANLPSGAVDLERGWLDFARVKTGIARRVPLWEETVAAVRAWCAIRPAPVSEDDAKAGIVFVTRCGRDWRRKKNDSPVTKEFAKLLARRKITGRSFYGLRRTFQNVGEERTKDFLAVRAIMGHATADISEFYREEVSRERLAAVTEAVRAWALT
jgi:integrase